MENKPKFTSGPWKWYILPDGDTLSLEPKRGIKSPGGQVLEIPLSGISEEDSALISAAPEMYEILNEVEEASRYRRPIKKATWLKVCEILKRVDGRYR